MARGLTMLDALCVVVILSMLHFNVWLWIFCKRRTMAQDAQAQTARRANLSVSAQIEEAVQKQSIESRPAWGGVGWIARKIAGGGEYHGN